MSDGLEDLWGEILSGDPTRIRSAVEHLSEAERRSVLIHLRRMALEPGWSDGQRLRAKTALESLGTSGPDEGSQEGRAV
jgi:hypothetical protein